MEWKAGYPTRPYFRFSTPFGFLFHKCENAMGGTACLRRGFFLSSCLSGGSRYSNWLCYGRSISNRRNPTEIWVLFYSWGQFACGKRITL
ncbi:hypothetical protein AVEN_107135-1 [Araneus ventricosus]|uniref:Uncharacterized protein n=1 Tax=Araneus ventricosus TaxID=182803 RepID=A0A4Y2VX75_ARAVE|nr:hypothetical protein AVEN_107135-1 [Araneus ventricosus]